MAFPKNVYGFTSLIGGGQGALDRPEIDGADLEDQDLALGVVNGVVHQYWLDEDSGAAENSPYVIAPDANAGDKRWILSSINKLTGDLDAAGHSINNVSGIDGILPLGGDGTAGRILRGIYLKISDGAVADTLKCTVGNRWNGDAIAETNNIAKDGLTGHFWLNDTGTILAVVAAGITGNSLYVIGSLVNNTTGTVYIPAAYAENDGISILVYDINGAIQDITAIVNAGDLVVDILYITDA